MTKTSREKKKRELDPDNPAHATHVGDWRQWQPTLADHALSALSWGTAVSWLVGWTNFLTPMNYLFGAHKIPVHRLSQFFSRGMVASTFSSWKAWVHPDVRDD